MNTIYDKLKEDYRKLIESSPLKYDDLIQELKSKEYAFQVSYGSFCQLQHIAVFDLGKKFEDAAWFQQMIVE